MPTTLHGTLTTHGTFTFSIQATDVNGYSGTQSFVMGIDFPGSAVISGIPTTPGTYPFTITVTDATSEVDTKNYIIVIGGGNNDELGVGVGSKRGGLKSGIMIGRAR